MATVTAMGSIPESLAAVTPDWLADAMRLPVVGLDLQVIGQGEGFLGQLGRVALRYGADAPTDAPTSVIVKLPTQDPGGRAIGMMMGVWERESRFYDEVASHMRVRVPRIFANLVDGDRYALVMEDLAPLHPADQVAGATPAQARRVIDELAVIHGTWWNSPMLPDLAWLPGLDSPMTGAIKPMFDMGWPAFCERFAARVAPRTLRWAQEYSTRVGDMIARYLGEPYTLTHGDFRLDNMFFDPAGLADSDFAIVDWQMAMRSPGGSDLVYFIVTNLPPELRRSMERELVERYQRGLAALGVTGDYATVERLWQGYLEGIAFYTVSFGGGLLTIDPANQRGVDLFDELVMRTYIAADDLAVGEVLGLD
jgi:hypothetical protein